MECYYKDEVIEIIEDRLEFHQRHLEGLSEQGFDKCQYAIGVLKHLLAEMKALQVKEFQYSE